MFFRRKKSTSVNKNTKKVTTTTSKKKPIYEIDGYKYHSKALRDYHEVLAKDKHVKSFELPTIDKEKEMLTKRFGAFKVKVNGIQFDSIMESKFYVYLLDLKSKKEIKSFERQVTFELQPGFTDARGRKVLPIKYIADFVVTDKVGDKSVVDVKGMETPEFKLKKKMFQYLHRKIEFRCLQWVPKRGQWLDLEEIKKSRKATTRKK